ncbi:MAG: hypothetical protein HY020_09605 [Burkholderiales bacterium]|nr:hypothetical protein [Burkholderiales bacterium]
MTTHRDVLTRWLAPALLAVAGTAAVPAAQAADVGVSIGFSQPGVYGRVDIGRYPQPVLFAPQPVIIGQPVYREPVYLWVPPEHRRDWRRQCYRYGACGAPVYFVQDGWYRQNVVVRERERDWRDHDHDHDRDDDHDRGRGHGHGRGHDRHHD